MRRDGVWFTVRSCGHMQPCIRFTCQKVCVCVYKCTVKGAGIQDAQGDAGIHAIIKSAPQEAGREAEIRLGYYQPPNSSQSLGSAPRYILLNTHSLTCLHTYMGPYAHMVDRQDKAYTHSTVRQQAITHLSIQSSEHLQTGYKSSSACVIDPLLL